MRVLCEVHDYPPTGMIGSFRSMHHYMAGLVEAGHRVDVLIGPRVQPYTLDGVRVQHTGAMLGPKFQKADLGISHLGDDSAIHKLCIRDRKPSIRFVHGSHDTKLHDIHKYGTPTLVVFNSHSMAEAVGYDGPQIICLPRVDSSKYRTTPGEFITLINMIDDKGVYTFDKIARWLPERRFLGVRGGYGKQVELYRPNITTIGRTLNMRDDVYHHTRILLMPSEHESWGLVAVEAMCSGIPVIAHPTPGLREVLGTAGIFADRNDSEAWVEAIEALDEPDVYMEAAGLALERVEQLDVDDSIERFVRAAEALL